MGRLIPKKFLQKGLDLNKWYVNRIGWEKDDALNVIEYLIANNCEIGISGGDVYSFENSELPPPFMIIGHVKVFSMILICEYNKRSLIKP